MVRYSFTLFVLTVSLFLTVQAQDPSKILIADGAKYYFANGIYGVEAIEIEQKLRNMSTRLPGVSYLNDDSYYVKEPISGNFTAKDTSSKAYLYSICGKDAVCKHQGIAVLSEKSDKTIALLVECSLPYEADASLLKLPDINGNGIDEIAIIFQYKRKMLDRTSVRIIEFTSKGIASLGVREIYSLATNPVFKAKLYAEKGTAKFYEERETVTARGWTKAPLQEIKLDEDKTQYIKGAERNAILKHLFFFTFLIQAIAFIGLFAFVVYEFFNSIRDIESKESHKREREERRAGEASSITEDHLPKLDPINCQSCGAGVPLQEGEMVCPNCGTKTKAPENYFNVARTREGIATKIRSAATYLKRATILTSGWVRALIALLALWLAVSMTAVFVLSNKGNFEPYQGYIFGNAGFKALGGFASFTNFFWVISLLMGFAIWSPRLKKTLPMIELGETISKAENGNCPQCGGGIGYRENDLATVCGYCGVETYRAQLAWKLKNLTNVADKKASFSLIEARKYAEDAIEDVIGTPKVLMFLLVLAAILGIIAWLISAGYDMLPEWLTGVLELIGEVLSFF